MYEGFFREHQYGLSNQTFGSWFRDQAVGFAVNLVLAGWRWPALFAVVRRLPRTWHIWGTVVAIAFRCLHGGDRVRSSSCRCSIPPSRWRIRPSAGNPEPGSRQRHSGARRLPDRRLPPEQPRERQRQRLAGTERITLNDNLLRRCSPEGVLSVMGHEMGHYVMHHVEIGHPVLRGGLCSHVRPAAMVAGGLAEALGSALGHSRRRGRGRAAARRHHSLHPQLSSSRRWATPSPERRSTKPISTA